MNSPESSRLDAAKLAAILLDLQSLQARAPESEDPADVLQAILKLQQLELNAVRERILRTEFEWWQVMCSPLFVWRFRQQRRSSSEPDRCAGDWADLRILSDLITRIQFGYVLDPATVAHLHRFVRAGALTARDVWRLTHSLGCRVVRESISPAPINSFAARGGLAVGIGLSVCAIASGYQSAAWLMSGSGDGVCAGVGYAVLSYSLAHIAPMVVCCTWGRRDAAQVLSYLLSNDPPFMPRQEGAVSRSLLARLTW